MPWDTTVQHNLPDLNSEGGATDLLQAIRGPVEGQLFAQGSEMRSRNNSFVNPHRPEHLSPFMFPPDDFDAFSRDRQREIVFEQVPSPRLPIHLEILKRILGY